MNDLQLSPAELEEDTRWQDNGSGYCVHCGFNPSGHEYGSAICLGLPEDPDDYREEPEYEDCPTHGRQPVKGHGSTGGPDPYSKTHLACGDSVICLGPGDPMTLCGKWSSGDMVPERYR